MALSKIPDTGRASVCVKYLLNLHMHWYYFTAIFIPNKELKYHTVRLNTGHLATAIVAVRPHIWRALR